MFNKLIGDITFRLSLFDQLLQEMVSENPDIWTDNFKDELTHYMVGAVNLEKELISALPVADAGLEPDALETYIEFLADERLAACKLPRQFHHAASPFPWLDDQIHLVTKQAAAVSSSTLNTSFDDDDL